ncbi:proton-conducting transporter transmembrane domain-containing protein [Mongoliitalea daihaiensis]|uniref:proton-conducting transporter transmembrane domain-containing protein n=1 Tax=Mongoliitalea daihaiensis TaxID=2782006 RepID=UPI001F427E18|nr:proton-conducting transporter membrane subunit [Mongoliitalea daihaiensis]UJP64066.1 Na+/H+ antiporter subunit D [Mongoliitalea daihaiensis]
MTNPFIILPIVFHMAAAMVLLFFWFHVKIQKILSMVFSCIGLAISSWLFILNWQDGIQVTQAGNWSAPFGITFAADTLGTTLGLLASISLLAVSIFSTVSMRAERLKFGFFPVLHFLIMGLQGAFLTADIFNLYVWFEVVIISSFVLLTLGGKKAQLEGALKYVSLNLLASTFFLIGIAFIYGLTGTLNMADLAIKMPAIENQGLVNMTAGIFLVAFGIKSAIFPMYFWLPASYHTPPAAISAIFAGLLTKVGVYALFRMFTLLFVGDNFMSITLSGLAILTIIAGGLGAIRQQHLGKIFGYLIICHIGFLIAGIGIGSELAITGAVFYLIHDIVVKTNLFIISGFIGKLTGSQLISEQGGIYAKYPLLALLMAVPLFSLVGIPPLSGFWAKIYLVQSSFEKQEYFIAFAIILGSFLTLWVIAKVWTESFWKDQPSTIRNGKDWKSFSFQEKLGILTPIIFLSVCSLYIGLDAENIASVANRIAVDLLNPAEYIDGILSIKK